MIDVKYDAFKFTDKKALNLKEHIYWKTACMTEIFSRSIIVQGHFSDMYNPFGLIKFGKCGFVISYSPYQPYVRKKTSKNQLEIEVFSIPKICIK